jgi:hypothetical protein
VTASSRRNRPGIQIHTASLPPDEVTSRQAIPVTSVPRTLLDLAALLPSHQTERAANEAEVRGLTDGLCLADLVARYPRRSGVRAIKSIIDGLVVLLGTFARKRRGSGAGRRGRREPAYWDSTWATEDDGCRFRRPSFPVKRFGKGH